MLMLTVVFTFCQDHKDRHVKKVIRNKFIAKRIFNQG